MPRTTRTTLVVGIVVLIWMAGPVRVSAQMSQTAPMPRPGESVATDSDASLRQWSAVVTRMERDRQLRVESSEDDQMMPGRRHQRLRQYYLGVPVFGGEVTRQMSGTGVVSIFGSIYTDIALRSTTPKLSRTAAQTAMAKLASVPPRSVDVPELTILPVSPSGYLLTYMSQIRTDAGPVVYFIDASTGAAVWQYNNRQTGRRAR